MAETGSPGPRRITVTYRVPDAAPPWFEQCVADGDRNGILEYAETLRVESVEVVGE